MKIDVNSMARRVEVDNRIPLRYYYRIADNLLKQANVYREEKNLVDLYIMLLRYSSLISETIPYHRDYQAVLPKERSLYRKKLLSIVDELESIKPEVDHQVKELNERNSRAQLLQLDGSERTSYSSQTYRPLPLDNKKFPSTNLKQLISTSSQFSRKSNDEYPGGSDNSTQLDKHFQKLAIKLPAPNSETLSRHSFLGPNGLRGQWQAPSAEIKVQYPNSTDLPAIEIPIDTGPNQAGRFNDIAVKDDSSVGISSTMDSVLSLDDGRWKNPLSIDDSREDFYQLSNIRQPNPPPVLAQIHQDSCHIHPSKVADPRPGTAKSSQDGSQNYSSFQHLHVPVRLMEDFLRLARANTEKNLETCAILAGSLKNRVFHITTLIVPKQESTSDSCQTLNEEELFEVQDKLSLFSLGWIHTHPTQTCFMSSVDLHTHYSYQIMLPEAIAIVMAPTDSSCPHGIFHLSDPGGVSVIRNCQERGFHPHEEPLDGTSIYEHCSHVFMNPHIKFEVIDLR